MYNILIDINEFEPNIGSSNDMLDLAYYSQDLPIKYYMTGKINVSHRAQVEKKGIIIIEGESLPRSAKNILRYMISVLFWIIKLKRLKIQIVHFNYATWGPSLACAANILNIGITARAGGSYHKNNKSMHWVKKFAALCKEQATDLLRSPVKERVHIIGGFVNLDKVMENAKRPSTIFAEKSDTINIIYVGQLVERKGIHLLIEAFKKLDENCHLYLIGGNWSVDQFAQQLKQQIVKSELQERIHTLDHRTDVASIINKADIIVLPSFSEARPRVILESMILGKCVIATSVGGVPDMIIDGTTGLLVEPNNVDKLADGLITATSNFELRERLGANAKEFCKQNIDPYKSAKSYFTFFKNVII